jgi:hypothetical protein
MDGLLDRLQQLGADQLGHANGTLQAHLRGTCERLRTWGNTDAVCLSGLFHAVYGTYGFSEQLLGIDRRDEVARLIGSEAEQLVYFYAACDRAYFYPRLARDKPPSFKDRFTDAVTYPDRAQVLAFCELTLANEIDVALPDQASYLARYGRYVLPLFRSEPFRESLSQQARAECLQYFR